MITFSEAFGVGIHIAYEKKEGKTKSHRANYHFIFRLRIAPKVVHHLTPPTIRYILVISTPHHTNIYVLTCYHCR